MHAGSKHELRGEGTDVRESSERENDSRRDPSEGPPSEIPASEGRPSEGRGCGGRRDVTAAAWLKAIYATLLLAIGVTVWWSADSIYIHRTKFTPVYHPHYDARRFMIKSQTAQTSGSPIMLVGDSITEGARVPSVLCDAPVVNAGIGCEGVSTNFPDILIEALAGRKAKLIVVALGTNDVWRGATNFKGDYQRLLARLRPFTERLLLVGIPPMSPGALNSTTSNVAQFNEIIHAIAAAEGLAVIDLDELSGVRTLDGIHLTHDGYMIWRRRLEEGIKGACA
jgi:lysophospholipase L1-like esterase